MNTLVDPSEQNETSELEMLKSRAKLMGVTFSNNISVETLRKRINDKMEGKEEEPVKQETAQTAVHAPNPLMGQDAPGPRKTIRQHLHDEEMKLVRVRITNMDPKKKDLPGEIFTVANEYIGTVRKYIPYGEATEDGYHIPNIIFKQLKARKFLNIRTLKDKHGGVRVDTAWAQEFALEVLPQLTKEELNRLATAQIAAGSVEVS